MIEEGRLNKIEVDQVRRKVQEMQANLQKEAMQANKKMAAKERELTEPIYKLFNKAIAKGAKKNAYAYVIDKQLLLHHAEGTDATEKIKTELGLSW